MQTDGIFYVQPIGPAYILLQKLMQEINDYYTKQVHMLHYTHIRSMLGQLLSSISIDVCVEQVMIPGSASHRLNNTT